jgi:hypothetical protein
MEETENRKEKSRRKKGTIKKMTRSFLPDAFGLKWILKHTSVFTMATLSGRSRIGSFTPIYIVNCTCFYFGKLECANIRQRCSISPNISV